MKKTAILFAVCLTVGTAAAQTPAEDWGSNWFLSVKGGVSAFVGKPVGHGDLFDREKPLLNVSVGKWFTPYVGGRHEANFHPLACCGRGFPGRSACIRSGQDHQAESGHRPFHQ